MKILLVSDQHHWSTIDTFNGIKRGLQLCGVEFCVAELHDLVDPRTVVKMSLDGALHLILAKLLNVDNGFTHCLMVSGLSIPEWFLKTGQHYGIKMSIWENDAPHASVPIHNNKKYLEYIFTNEKTLEDIENNIVYVSTGTDTNIPSQARNELPETYINDVVFIGTIYPDREKPLADACRFCEEHNLKIKIIGPTINIPHNSIIRKYLIEGMIENQETKLLYIGSKVVINVDRNVFWNPNEMVGNSLLLGTKEPYSVNPRCHEVALCKSLQLYINARQEAHDIYGDNIIYADDDNIYDRLKYIFTELTNEEIENKIQSCFERVKKSGLYLFKAQKIIDFLKQGEDNE